MIKTNYQTEYTAAAAAISLASRGDCWLARIEGEKPNTEGRGSLEKKEEGGDEGEENNQSIFENLAKSWMRVNYFLCNRS